MLPPQWLSCHLNSPAIGDDPPFRKPQRSEKMAFPFHHHHRRDDDEDDEPRHPPPGYRPPYSDPPPPLVPHIHHTHYGEAPPPPPPSYVDYQSNFPPEPPVPDYGYSSGPPPPVVHHHSHHPHSPTVIHQHSHQSDSPFSNRPTVKVYAKANPNFSLAIRDGKVVLVPSDPYDPAQVWSIRSSIALSFRLNL